MIPTPEKLGLFYASKDIVTEGSPLPDRSVSAGSTLLSITTPSITQPTGYWNGAVGFFFGSSTTAALRGKMFHVSKWVKEENRLYITSALPVVPTTTDKFRIFAGGKMTSSQEVFGLLANDRQPEADVITATNIAGTTLTKCSGMLGEGLLTIQYTGSTKAFAIKMGTGVFGPETIATANGEIVVFNSDFSGYIKLNIVFGSLLSSTLTDTYTLSIAKNVLIPNYEGYETNTGKLVERYHLLAVKNLSDAPTDAMTALSFWNVKPDYPTATTGGAVSNNLCGQPGTLNVNSSTSISTWPAKGFWIWASSSGNTAAAYYVLYRNGQTLFLAPRTDGLFLFTNGTNNLVVGETFQFGTNVNTVSGTFIITRIDIESGTLAGGNARGVCHFTKATGTSENMIYSGTSAAIYNVNNLSTQVGNLASTSYVYRGWRPVFDSRASNYDWMSSQMSTYKPAVTPIASGVKIEVMPDFDLGISPMTVQHADPANEYTYPEGLGFQTYTDQDKALVYENPLLGGSTLGLWIRQTIVDGTQARQNIVGNIRAMWY